MASPMSIIFSLLTFVTVGMIIALASLLCSKFSLYIKFGGVLKRVQMRSIPSQAKLLRTCTTIGGAMIMTLIRGPMIIQGCSNQTSIIHQTQRRKISLHDTIKGSVLISFSCLIVNY
ncbi:hypothetical protein V2J09_000455 [Rumex salicifolius]